MDDRLSLIIQTHTHPYVEFKDGKPTLIDRFWTIVKCLQPRVYLVDLQGTMAVLKLEDEHLYMDSAINELGIGLLINPYIHVFPCFVRTYTGFQASLPYNGQPGTYQGPPNIMGNYVLTEYVPGPNLYEYMLTTKQTSWPTIYYLLMMVERLNYYTQFSHNDLHFYNVIMKNQPGIYPIPNTGRGVYLEYLPVIIDYGRSNMLIYGPVNPRYGIRPGSTAKLDQVYILYSYFTVLGRPDDFPLRDYFKDDQTQTYLSFPDDGVQQFIQRYGDPTVPIDTLHNSRTDNYPPTEIMNVLQEEHRQRELSKELDHTYNQFYEHSTRELFIRLKDQYNRLKDISNDKALSAYRWIDDYTVV